ncbi:MAG: glycosyltransferase family 2 protein [Elusimicrobia bacterium]|nr:glycosyltransferase family 2 protein [Elusimicrobiota bacterium]
MPPLLTIAVCALNEEKTLPRVLAQLFKIRLNIEIIVVDDGSTDQTAFVVEEFVSEHQGVRLIQHSHRSGKGAALASALAQAHGEYFAVQDADLEYDPLDLPVCFETMLREKWDILFGSRFLRPNPTAYPLFLAGNKIVSFWISLITGLRVTDAYTGRKIFKTAVLRTLGITASGFDVEAELAVKASRAAVLGRLRFGEIPIVYCPRTVQEGKKIRYGDGYHALKEALLWRWRVG